MKDKDDVGYAEKDRHFRDRSKRRRIPGGEAVTEKLNPKHQPYKRTKKDWMQLPTHADDEEE